MDAVAAVQLAVAEDKTSYFDHFQKNFILKIKMRSNEKAKIFYILLHNFISNF